MISKKQLFLAIKNSLRFIPDKLYIKLLFFLHFHKSIDFENPRTFNEKIQLYKLFYKNDLMTLCADKLLVRDYVANKIGAQYLTKLYGVYDNCSVLEKAELPDEYVLKCTHDSQSVQISTNSSPLNKKIAYKNLNRALNRNWFWQGREWAYKNITPRIICEEYLTDGHSQFPKDYKFYCFNGRVALIQVDIDRFNLNHEELLFDENWNSLGDWNSDAVIKESEDFKPSCFDKLLQLSEILSSDFPHARIDWYVIDEKIYFGEITFYTGSGFDLFYDTEKFPDSLDSALGELFLLEKYI